MTLRKVIDSGAHITPPRWLRDNLAYETMMGSVAYGVSNDSSDMDVYGVVMPPKELVFPHITGEISGFGRQIQRFSQWQEHGIKALDKTWDFSIYGIVNFMQLAMDNNPNILDSIFTPVRCVISTTAVGTMIRENRRLLLHKGSWPKFKGYAYQQMSKIRSKKATGKRAELIEKHGYDTKFAYHVVRLLNQGEQILATGDMDIELCREQLKSVRRGEWTLEQLEEWAKTKERTLDELYTKSTLRHGPDEPAVRQVLVDCLEHHYGSLSTLLNTVSDERRLLGQIAEIVKGY
ncbi:MAG: nucleotidyltransferase domain-containing protein [Candidatus Paceibacterota bacterium]|jgi:predicted nucleotidyltransferase